MTVREISPSPHNAAAQGEPPGSLRCQQGGAHAEAGPTTERFPIEELIFRMMEEEADAEIVLAVLLKQHMSSSTLASRAAS